MKLSSIERSGNVKATMVYLRILDIEGFSIDMSLWPCNVEIIHVYSCCTLERCHSHPILRVGKASAEHIPQDAQCASSKSMRCLQKAKDGAPALAGLGNQDEISKIITKDKDYNFVEEFNRQLRLRRLDGLHRIHAAGRGRQKP